MATLANETALKDLYEGLKHLEYRNNWVTEIVGGVHERSEGGETISIIRNTKRCELWFKGLCNLMLLVVLDEGDRLLGFSVFTEDDAVRELLQECGCLRHKVTFNTAAEVADKLGGI